MVEVSQVFLESDAISFRLLDVGIHVTRSVCRRRRSSWASVYGPIKDASRDKSRIVVARDRRCGRQIARRLPSREGGSDAARDHLLQIVMGGLLDHLLLRLITFLGERGELVPEIGVESEGDPSRLGGGHGWILSWFIV